MYFDDSKSKKECMELFHQLFDEREKLLQQLSPQGWEKSSLYLIHHPTPQQRYKEALRIHRNLDRLFKARSKKSDKPPRREDFVEEKEDQVKINPIEEF